jgi:hypothetical protein
LENYWQIIENKSIHKVIVMKKYSIEYTRGNALSPSAELETCEVFSRSLGQAEDFIISILPLATVLSIRLVE